jgi:phosphoglycolate phosphatase-like HAD superfamily hydrolase
MAAYPIPRLQLQPEPAVDAVVFDYDGTLVASRLADEAAVAELIEANPAAAAGADVFWHHEGKPIVTRIELAWPGSVAEILPLFECQTPPRRFPGITRLLEELDRAGLLMAVVSSRRRAALVQSLEATGLRSHFPVVVGLDDVSQPKPSPEGLLLALRRLGVEASRTVFVGDNELDVEAGHRAGITVWKAVWGLPPLHPAPGSSNGTVLLRRPGEVGERLETLPPR